MKRSLKQQLMMSVIALLLCCSMLIGTTFAWFTDSVTSAGNIIKSGTLDVDFLYADGIEDPSQATWSEISGADGEAIFSYDLWEPGYTVVKHVKIANNGSLALKYQLSIVPKNYDANAQYRLADVIDVYYADPAVQVANRTDLADDAKVGTLSNVLAAFSSTANGKLEAGQSDVVTIALKMQETAGNEYQDLSFGESFDIVLFATQVEHEEDSFDIYYDIDAPIEGKSYAAIPDAGVSGIGLEVRDTVTNKKIGSFSIPTAALEPGTTVAQATMEEIEYKGNFTVAAGNEVLSYDISVPAVKANNDVPVTVTINIPAGLDPAQVKLYHYDTLIDSDYNPSTGLVTFSTTSFSPFSVVYNPESEYVAPVVPEPEVPGELPEGIPTATVIDKPEYVYADLNWGSYGQWSPTEGLDSYLEAAYTFTCNETPEVAQTNDFRYWHCDFYVSLDRDLGENQIFLGGNYGSFGWVGFHNGDVTLEANTELPLLGSVTNNPWTYLDVVNTVREFTCGVGDVDNALVGATFTVKLRLTNPDDANIYYDVATITHTFDDATVVTTGEELQDAVNNGAEEIVLGGDIDLSQGLVIPGLN